MATTSIDMSGSNKRVSPQLLAETDLPPLYRAADVSSTKAQTWFLWAARLRSFGLLGAASFGLFTWKFSPPPVDWAGVLAASCFAVALVVEGYLYQATPERTWYEGRAAAESVKTLSWRYAVGGEPFNIGATPESVIADLFLEQLKDLFAVIKDLDLVPPTSSGEQITRAMRDARASLLIDRKAMYELGRVNDQQNWYQAKAIWNERRANYWTRGMLAVEIVGVVCAILKAVGVIEGDLLGFAGAVVATMTAWLQTKQHRTLATAYAVTTLELASVRSKIAYQNNESDWAKFVADAEEAFSREHTLWKASRGIRSI
jgi:SMODS and SLOG-associating 2TM effector domain 3/SMODS and SLOG-associating 2TM effector domain 1